MKDPLSTEQQDIQLIAFLMRDCGYERVRRIPHVGLCGLNKFLFTTGLLVGLDRVGYRERFCYHTYDQAAAAIEAWDGSGDPPGPWIKAKGQVEREGPGSLAGIPVVTETP